MTGEGVVLTEEDRAGVDHTEEQLRAELKPRTVLGGFLVHQLAVYMTRLKRSALWEEACLAHLVRHAAAQFDDQRRTAPEAELDRIVDAPSTSARRLHETAEGLGLLIRCWQGLWDDLIDPRRWGYVHWQRAENLMGRRPHEAPTTRLSALCQAAMGDFRALEPEDGAGLDDWQRRVWAAGQLRAWIEARVADLQARLASFDPAAVEQDRAEAAERALFDPSPAAVLARKYEASNQRNFFRTLKEYREVEGAAALQAPAPDVPAAAVEPGVAVAGAGAPDVTPEGEPGCELLGSFFPGTVSVAPGTPARPSGGPVRGVSDPPEGPGTVGGGRFWPPGPPR
jgi:hypothetical protein